MNYDGVGSSSDQSMIANKIIRLNHQALERFLKRTALRSTASKTPQYKLLLFNID